MWIETHIATKKDHRCDSCGRKIPIGSRYYSKDKGEFREHTNCEMFSDQEALPAGYNQNRSKKNRGVYE